MGEKAKLEQVLERALRYREELQRMIAEFEALEDGVEDGGVLRRLRRTMLDLECALDSVEDLGVEAVRALDLEDNDPEETPNAN